MKKRFVFFILIFFAALVLTSCKDKGEISLTDPVINLKVGESKKIKYEITEGREVEFSLPSENIARISGDNIVGVSAGEVELKATIKGTEISATATVKVTNVEAENIIIAGDTSGLIGAQIQLTATVQPDNTTVKTVTWSSSDETIATVDQTGKVSLLKAGQATIKAKVGSKEATLIVTVNPILVESITIAGDNSGLIGAQIQLTTTVLPDNATDKTVTWSSSDETIATVDQTGKVSLLKVGQVTINAKVGSKVATHAITVNPVLAESVTIAGAASGLIGTQIQLTATVLPANTTVKTVVWSSSDETIATVDQTGKVSLLKVGQATIKAKVGAKEKTHVITVNPILAESITIAGEDIGSIGAQIQLTATVLPDNTTVKTVVWSSSDGTIAAVDQTGKVSLLKVGEVTIKAKVGSKEATHVIVVGEPVAKIGTVSYISIQAAIDAAVDNDVILVLKSADEAITIAKSNLTLKAINEDIVYSGLITIDSTAARTNITIDGFKLTAGFRVKATGPMDGFTFKNNEVYDTTTEATDFAPYLRTNVNAIIQIYAASGTNINGNLTVINNTFRNIPSDIISYDRLSTDKTIRIENNIVKNFGRSFFRLDGGWNNGNIIISNNVLRNDADKVSKGGITFRCFGANSGIDLVLHITNNTFENIGLNIANNGRNPESGVITVGTNNGSAIDFKVEGNTFRNTANALHLNTVGELTVTTVKDNIFINNRGYAIFNTTELPAYEQNTFRYDEYEVVVAEHLSKFTYETGEEKLTVIYPIRNINITGDAQGIIGDEIQLVAELLPEDSNEDKTVTWVSSDQTLATVDDNGLVKLLAKGTVKITALTSSTSSFHEIVIDVPATGLGVSGVSAGLVGDVITLEASVLPAEAAYRVDQVLWSVNIDALASVTSAGVVTLKKQGKVVVTARIDDRVLNFEIFISSEPVAKIGDVGYPTIQAAIDAAVDNDVITILPGTHNEALSIEKSNISFTGIVGKKSILTNVIFIDSGLENISFTHLSFTGDAQIKKTSGTLSGFTFKNNHVYDTNLEASTYLPINRRNINAFIQTYTLSGGNVHGDFYIEDNIFENIQSDIISIDRTWNGKVIDIKNNVFRNFGVSAIRFDGGYNHGTYNIIGNTFENDVLGASSAITFRAYGTNISQAILIEGNTFTNIGNVGHNRDGNQPGSGVITFSTFNGGTTSVTINNNTFNHTYNSVHMRGSGAGLTKTITNNTFKDSLGYVYFENDKTTNYSLNVYLDRLGVEVAAERVIITDDPAYKQYNIAAPVLESFSISGAATGSVTDEVVLELVAVPPYYEFSEVVWTSSDDELATVVNGVVKLLAVGDVMITAKVGDLTATHDINITAKVAAKIGDVEYATIQAAIDAATAGDVINVNYGTFNEVLTIDKAVTLKGFAGQKSILTNKITINNSVNGVTIDGFKMTGKAQVYNAGTLENFKFINNHVYDTDLAATAYSPNLRTDVNAIIQIYTLSGIDLVGDITIEYNVFNNIKSDIISMSRTKVGMEINIRHNEFRNYGVGAIRFDGGYNNGTYNITDNIFENDEKQAETAILFRAYSSSSGNVQTINISSNVFKNIGNEGNNPTGTQPASAVIATSTYNENAVAFSIIDNQFINTHNSVHLRKNSSNGPDIYTVTVSNNTFVNPTGYLYHEDGNIVTYELNNYLDELENPIADANIEHIQTASLTKVSYVAEYIIVYHTFNAETEVYDVTYEIHKDSVGKAIKYIIPALEGYYVDEPVLEGVVTSDGLLRFDVHYHLIVIDPDAFTYQLELNGGNFDYETRLDLVNDFIADYNAVNGKSYTLDGLPLGAWVDVDYHNVFYHEQYRDKWLWLADYLGQVGSSTNRQSARDILTCETAATWNAKSDNWKYAFSYEVRAFLKGIHYTLNNYWKSADYSEHERANGFWPLYKTYKIADDYLSAGAEEVLPIPYKEGYNFVGWYLNENLTGEPVTTLTETAKLYAKYEEKTPITALEVANPITELLKGATHQLQVTITPADAYNKTLLYSTSDTKVAVVSEEGLITALNEGTVTITVTNYNATVQTTMTFTVYPGNDIKITFSEGYTGSLQVNDEFMMDVVGIGKDNTGTVYTYQVVDETVLEFTSPNKFKALKVGETTIGIYAGSELVKSYKVIVQGAFNDAERVDQLLELLAAGNNPVAQGLNVILVHQASSEYSQPKHESVNAYLFDDFVVDRTTYLADPNGRTSGIKTSTEFVLVHDTANVNGGLTSHGTFFKSATNVSIHYVVGDGGILQSIEDKYVAWHAGDGTSVPFNWLPTGVAVVDPDAKPEFDISADGYFTINGNKTTILAPKDGERILDKSYFTYLGPTWRIVGNQYELGTHYFTRNQQTYGVIASRGGNNNSIGIEMCVNTSGDSIDTLQRTAKLVANLLEQYNLPNSRVIMHNTTDGKADPYMINNTLYNGSWYFPRFMEHVEIEREVLKNYSDAIITFSSESPLVSNTGRVIAMPDETTVVEYTITVKIGEVSKSITLVSVVPGKHTWSQNEGNFKPLIRWAKADYRVDMRNIP